MGFNALLLGQSVVQSGRLRGQRLREQEEEERRLREAEEQRAIAADAWRMALQERQAQFQRDQLRQQADLAAQNRVHQAALQVQRLGQQGSIADENRKSRETIAAARRPSGTAATGSGGRMGPIQERHEIGEGLMEHIISQADALESRASDASEVPAGADLGAALAERVLGHGAGGRLAHRIRSGAMNPDQQRYQQLREQFKHSMAVFYPRAAIALMENLADSYFSVPGESPQARAEKRLDRAYLLSVIQRARSGDRSALDSLIARRVPELAASAGASHVPAGLEPQASASPDGTYTNQRSQHPARAPQTPTRDYSRFRTGGN